MQVLKKKNIIAMKPTKWTYKVSPHLRRLNWFSVKSISVELVELLYKLIYKHLIQVPTYHKEVTEETTDGRPTSLFAIQGGVQITGLRG